MVEVTLIVTIWSYILGVLVDFYVAAVIRYDVEECPEIHPAGYVLIYLDTEMMKMLLRRSGIEEERVVGGVVPVPLGNPLESIGLVRI